MIRQQEVKLNRMVSADTVLNACMMHVLLHQGRLMKLILNNNIDTRVGVYEYI